MWATCTFDLALHLSVVASQEKDVGRVCDTITCLTYTVRITLRSYYSTNHDCVLAHVNHSDAVYFVQVNYNIKLLTDYD